MMTRPRWAIAVATAVVAALSVVGLSAAALPAQSLPGFNPYGTPTNGCGNPILETDTAGWSTLTSGMTAARGVPGDHVVANWDYNAHNGSNTGPVGIAMPNRVVAPGQSWEFAADVRTDGDPAQIRVEVDWFNGSTFLSHLDGTWASVDGLRPYLRVALTATAPAGAGVAHVLVRAQGLNTGSGFATTMCTYRPVPAAAPTTTVAPTTAPPTSVPPTTAPPSTAPPTTTPPAPGLAAAGDPRSFWVHWNSTSVTTAQLTTEAQRRSFILLNAWEASYIPTLKAANPAIKVYVYKDLSSTRDYACTGGVDDAQIPTGVGYCEAGAHPDWFLTTSGGARYQYSGYAGHYQMNAANVAYQDRWISNVVANAHAGGFDGVLMDNALFHCADYHDDGSCSPAMPTDTALQTAYKAFLTNARPDFAAAGLAMVANLSNARVSGSVWNDYMAQLDGGWDEWWLAFSDTNLLGEYAEGWSKQMAEIEANEAGGKTTLVQPHFPATPAGARAFNYTVASYLMANGGHSAFTEANATDGYGNPTPWHPEYDWNLGAATGARASVGSNLWRRDYVCGAVVVNANATSSAAVTVQLGGPYLNAAGTSVTSVSLAGTSGAVLRKAGCTP